MAPKKSKADTKVDGPAKKAKTEAKQPKGKAEVKAAVKAAAKAEPTKDPKVEAKAEVTLEATAEPQKSQPLPDPKISPEVESEKNADVEEHKVDNVEPKEKELDATADKRPKNSGPIVFHPSESTLNVVPVSKGRILMAHSDGGMQYLIAGTRASLGMKCGRYFYEVKVLESLYPAEGAQRGPRSKTPLPRQLVRVGFSTERSELVLGNGDAGSFCFDTEGFFSMSGHKRMQGPKRFGRDQVIGVLLNLDPKSPNVNTVSIFRNGERASEPQALPEDMRGKTLFPHFSYRNVTLQVNFGPEPMITLPFKCRMLQDAAVEDIDVIKQSVAKDGKYEAVFPVGFPDQGTFDWVDGFLKENPQYVELSDRKIIEWAEKSGLWRSKGGSWTATKPSRDKPDLNFGVPLMDDGSVRRVINSIVSAVPRNYVVMEVKQNLVRSDRVENLKRFPKAIFQRSARIVMGEPSSKFKNLVKTKFLKEKQEKANVEWRLKKLEKERHRLIEKRKQEVADKQRQVAEEAKRMAEEAKKAAEAKKADEAKKAEDGKNDADSESNEKKDATVVSESKEEDKSEAAVESKDETKDEAMKGEEEEAEEETEPPPVMLTDEEEKMWFSVPAAGMSDLAPQVLDKFFGNFSIPEKAEGFDDLYYEWAEDEASKQYLRKWILEKKRTTKVEDLVPGDWFRAQQTEWTKLVQEWKAKQKEAKSKASTKKSDDADDDVVGADLFSVEDVCDIGNGEPLFVNFAFEDWTLLTLRWELHTLAHSFKKDANDEDRILVQEHHVPFYFLKYFQRQLSPKLFGKETLADVISLIKNTVTFEEGCLKSSVPEDAKPGTFVKMTEESRRERQHRIDAGDETARLKLAPSLSQPPPPQGPPPQVQGSATAARVVVPPGEASSKGGGKKGGKVSGGKMVYAPKATSPAT
eukprot:TRINITY_DN153_c0_g2_i1.p1 TRINITY_DN153_c0_g2~~TRINITY_DN153_c0_g2_i1.p1  ORF type:complete len:938 (+),score=215.02 TRINITY_DN153_c0_g2_i1:58-2814(+)